MTLLPRIEIGQVSNDGQGDRPRVVGQKINEAFETLEGLVDPSPAIAAANQAAGSAQSAAESLLAIGNSLVAAEASAEAADLSAQAAATSEQNAATSETNAATSESNAATSESNAATSAGNAATSESNAEAAKDDAVTAKNAAEAAQGDAETAADTATTQAGIATTQAGIATTQAGISAAEAARLQGTSTTSNSIGTGSKSFTTQASKAFDAGTNVTIVSDANPTADRMFGKSTSYDSGTGALTVNVVAVEGSGTHTDWTIYGRTGERGATAAGTGDFVGPASSVSGNLVSFGDTTGKLGADSGITPSAAGIAVLEAADAAAQRAALDLEPSVDVQAYSTNLAAIAGLTSAADKGIQFTGSGAAGTFDLTTAGKNLLDDASAADQRTTLGLAAVASSGSATDLSAGTLPDARLSSAATPYGKQCIPIPASAMVSRTTNGAAAGSVEMSTNKQMFKTLDFDTTTQEFAQFSIPMPASWNEGTVTFAPIWSHGSTSTNFGVVWALEAVAFSNDDAGDASWGTAQTSTDTGGTTNDIYEGPESSAITIAGSPSAGDIVYFQIKRVPSDGSDTMAIDARLHAIKLFITTDAGHD